MPRRRQCRRAGCRSPLRCGRGLSTARLGGVNHRVGSGPVAPSADRLGDDDHFTGSCACATRLESWGLWLREYWQFPLALPPDLAKSSSISVLVMPQMQVSVRLAVRGASPSPLAPETAMWSSRELAPPICHSLRLVRRDDARQFEPRARLAFQELVLGLGGLAEAVDLDEAQRGGGVVLVAFLVGGQLVAVEAVGRSCGRRSWRGP